VIIASITPTCHQKMLSTSQSQILGTCINKSSTINYLR
jgi:hypothetical protein